MQSGGRRLRPRPRLRHGGPLPRPGLALEDTTPESADGLNNAPPEVWINLATIVVLLVYLLLSIANKPVAATAQRRAELAALRLTLRARLVAAPHRLERAGPDPQSLRAGWVEDRRLEG
ncbi:hypothetical protein GCM10022403_092510 [Streptomyces coacervatus]|uniref:Uncharacterized protein n=1 Tax=Streptomyces coacervatus TaxID=647381 RepID=A0ABP7JL62_9ACTN